MIIIYKGKYCVYDGDIFLTACNTLEQAKAIDGE